MRLIETTGGRREERNLVDQNEYDAILRERFGIVMSGLHQVPTL
jgi:hypothetical protein